MLNISTALKNLELAPLIDEFEFGVIYIYSGTQPATADLAPTGSLLAKVTDGGGPYVFGNPANGLKMITTGSGFLLPDPAQEWIVTGVANGTAGWARMMTNNDNLLASNSLSRIDFAVNEGGTGLLLSSTAITNGMIKPVDYFVYGIPPF